ncbi:MAG TPA: exopolysaccharide biosynthesis polyprenyl glycosylphosphotransferase [Methylovirgula sp.]
MSFWNGPLPDFSEFLRLFRAETGLAQAFLPAALAGSRLRKKSRPVPGAFAALAIAFDAMALALSAALIASGQSRHAFNTEIVTFALSGLFFVVLCTLRNDYATAHYLTTRLPLRRLFAPWCLAFAMTLILVLPHAQADTHPLPVATIFLAGLGCLTLGRSLLTQIIRARAADGQLVTRRVFLVGREAELEGFVKSWEPYRFGIHIVAASVLSGTTSLEEDLALARAYARILTPDDVFILLPWNETATIEAAVKAFMGIPAALYLGAESLLERFSDARIARMGPIRCLNLVDHPLSPAAHLVKRTMDLVLASTALVLLAPLFLIVAAAVKLDSPGPIIFRQHRYGFNQKPFRIFKFRSMTTCEDHSNLVQVTTRTDSRVTRIGAFLRSHNIDELPQLLNVILGDMSLVGPRPMAVAHDQMFERSIALYARRHNVKPGITGWAQINGCRGGLSEEKIRARVEHDLYYIDNWSLWFDITILWRTMTSKEAYMDAF